MLWSQSVLQAATLLATAGGLGQAGSLTQEYLANVRTAARDLARELRHTQDAIFEVPSPGQPTGLFSQSEQVMLFLTSLQTELQKENPSGDVLRTSYGNLESRLKGFLDLVNGLGVVYQPVKQAARRLNLANDELHYAIFATPQGDQQVRQVVDRQARALLSASDALERTAPVALADKPGGKELQALVKEFDQAVEQFSRSAQGKAEMAALKNSFGKVDAAWNGLVAGLNRLPPQENLYLLSQAVRLDEIQQRLFRLLGLPGSRTRINPGI